MAGTKLELTRPGKNKAFELEPRILIEKPELSYGDKDTENMLIHGDNLLALKALEQQFTGKIKCIYIDPPYNTGSAFEFYDDGLEHTEWLNLMRPRLELLRNLLADDGLIFVQIDDNEQAYLTVMMDEIFGRINRINTIVVNMSNMSGVKVTSAINGKRFPKIKEYILLYAKDKDSYSMSIPKYRKENWDNEYNIIIPEFSLDDYQEMEKENYEGIIGKLGTYSLVSLKEYMKSKKIDEGDVEWKMENSYRIFASKPNTALLKKCMDMSFDTEVGCVTTSQGLNKLITTKFNRTTKTARIELVSAKSNMEVFFGDHWSDIVTTGGVGQEGGIEFKNGKKPEKLVSRVIETATKEGDFVLDSFLGSGTTAAVAHKMGRKWIGIELGDHAYSHCKVRLDSVIDGEQTGITGVYERLGGGGYKFYELGPSVLLQDKYGNFIINPNFNSSELVQAICKIENFTYKAYDDNVKHGYSTEKDFIHVTTRHITQEIIKDIQENSLKEGETMLIVAKTFESNLDLPSNIQIKKIPTEILDKCEYNKDNYSLPISKEEITDED